MCRLSNRLVTLAAAGALVCAAGAEAQQTRTPAPAPPDNLAVVGVTQIGDRIQAYLVDLNTRRRIAVTPGTTAFGYQVKAIDADRVALTRNGREYSVRLGERDLPAARIASRVPVAAQVAPGVGQGVVPANGMSAAPVVAPAPVAYLPVPVEEPVIASPQDLAEQPSPGLYPNNLVPSTPYQPGYGYVQGPDGALYPSFNPTYPVSPYGVGYPQDLGYAPWLAPAPLPYTGGQFYVPAVPANRWNPQTSRRRSGDYFSGSASNNPQTQRRRIGIRRVAPGTTQQR